MHSRLASHRSVAHESLNPAAVPLGAGITSMHHHTPNLGLISCAELDSERGFKVCEVALELEAPELYQSRHPHFKKERYGKRVDNTPLFPRV